MVDFAKLLANRRAAKLDVPADLALGGKATREGLCTGTTVQVRTASDIPVVGGAGAGDGASRQHTSAEREPGNVELWMPPTPLFTYLAGAAGCLSGETIVDYNRGARHSARPITLGDFYRKFNGLPTINTRGREATRWDVTLPTFLHSLGDDGGMFYNRVVAVYESGVQPLLSLELSEGCSLRVTADHRILTTHGFVPAGELESGQAIILRGTMLAQAHGGRDLSVRPPRVIVNVKYHPYGAIKVVDSHDHPRARTPHIYEYTRVYRNRLVVEAAINELAYDEFVHILKHNADLAATLRYLPPDFEVHHDDEDTLNDDLTNLVVMSKAEHARLHDQRGNFHVDSIQEEPVVGVTACADEMTYDILMESPANNFCANGIVVHNSGKTFAVKDWASRESGLLLCATTGIAAINLGGTTINAQLGYFDTHSLQEKYTTGYLTATLGKLWKAGVRRLVVDEVSMMDGDQLTYLVKAIEEVNNRGYVLTKSQDDDLGTPAMGLTLVGDFCFGLGTPIMLADGSICAIEDLRLGMQVMGPDSRPRTIRKLMEGVGALYRVHQTNGDSYTVNAWHQLVLKRSPDGQRQEWGGRRYPRQDDHCLISAPDLLKKSQKFRECFVGYKAGVVDLPPVPVALDPYFLGLWLGDGDSDAPRITTADPEVIDYCRQYASHWPGLRAHSTRWRTKTTKAVRVAIGHERTRGHASNPVRTLLRTLGVFRNKHIPPAYLLNDEELRLRLLAGLLDSDGSWTGNRYTITLTIERLAYEVKQLADQLGFRASIHRVMNGWYATPGRGGAWTITIGGDTWRIPCRVPRKQSIPRRLGRSRLTSVLSVTPVGTGTYRGFEVGGDQLFLLGDGTVAHNCQLPPVKAPFAFESSEWNRFEGANTITLTEIRRQADPDFIEALRAARRGEGKAALAFFGPTLQTETDDRFDGPTLLAKNDSVNRYNWIRMNRLSGAEVSFPSSRWGKQRSEWGNADKPSSTWGIPERLSLKIGALVMILANKRRIGSSGFLYVNGDLGELVEASEGQHTAEIRLQRTGESVTVDYVRREVLIPLDSARRKELRALGQDDLITEDGKWEIAGWIRYLPIRVAYASTVHKSQGLSLNRVQVNIRDAFFKTPAMLYVALSRARTAEGLRLVGSAAAFVERCTTDTRLQEYL